MKKNIVFGAIVAATFACGAASAATVPVVVNFDNPLAPAAADSSYTVDGYTVSPVNRQNGQCYSGFCTIESGQGNLPDITREDGNLFNLTSFWFSLQGNGQKSENFIEVIGYNGLAIVKSLKISIEDLFLSLSPSSIAYVVGEGGTQTNDDDCKNTVVCKGTGYGVTLSGFTGLTKVDFGSATSANVRLDDIGLSRDVPPVPLPAAAWLLLGGIGGLAALRRRKKVA